VQSPEGDTVRAVLKDLRLETVCGNAHCPNIHECYCRGTATFMLMGRICTRYCRFCAVEGGTPAQPEVDEPRRIAEAITRMKLRHVVLTSVTRDDLPDGGAAHFAETIYAIRRRSDAFVEVLTPDFGGQKEAVAAVLDAAPDIFNHNVETVPRLYPTVRPEADYERSLDVLKQGSKRRKIKTKSGFMVGLGETDDEIRVLMQDLHKSGVNIITIGQYLQPSEEHLPVKRFVPPEEFDILKQRGREIGIAAVAAGPFVRSSYNAEAVYRELLSERNACNTK